MKLVGVKLRNFRKYDTETHISFEDLTAFVGKNDAGKSSILEALEIFFNNKLVVCEKEDLSISHAEGDETIEISCIFSDFKDEIVLDATSVTTLRNEHLLNEDGLLEIKKIYKCSVLKPKPETFLVCNHPTADKYSDLLSLKIKDLKDRAKALSIEPTSYDARSSVSIRNAIKQSCDDLKLKFTELPVDGEDSKRIYAQLESFLPIYALFQSDRASSDSDKEIVDPMQIAVQQALKDLEPEISKIKSEVRRKAIDTANRTLEKLKEMNSDLADSLTPEFKSEPKFDSLFKLTINSDNGIPMNKRGSGVRRLVLLNFFRAEAERRLSEDDRNSSIIYAFEEPETSQHPSHQKILVDAFLELAKKDNNQVILTTHTPALCSLLPLDGLRLVSSEDEMKVLHSNEEVFGKIAEMLGILPDVFSKNAKGVLLVEGKDDVLFFRHTNGLLKSEGIIEKDFDELGIALALTGGCDNLKSWITEKIVHQFGVPWAIFLDSDRTYANEETKNVLFAQKYKVKGIPVFLTQKRELENYLHPDLFQGKYDISDYDDIKKIIEQKVFAKNWGKMTYTYLADRQKYEDANGNTCFEINDTILKIIKHFTR